MEHATAREELAAIRSLMADSQSFLSGTWPHQLVWGLIGSVGVVATWAVLRVPSLGWIPWIWALLVAAGWAFSLRRIRAEGSAARVRNVASRAFGGIWLGLGVSLTLLGFVTVATGAVDPQSLPGLIAVVFGGGYFASGFLSGLGWMTAVGVLWWAGGVALLLWAGPNALLALGFMTLALEVGPALALRRADRSARG